jgi:hypothetical protein
MRKALPGAVQVMTCTFRLRGVGTLAPVQRLYNRGQFKPGREGIDLGCGRETQLLT